MINVTKPFLPPLEEYNQYIEGIWKRNWLTNNGPLVNELELKLKEYLGLDHLLYLNNGTIALQIAIKALELKGEIITTPFSYVATTSSIVWEGCTPVFADIDPHSLNIDPARIEAVVTPATTAILATHVYGNPCDIDAIAAIASRHGLKVIYDGAHCFGTRYKGRSVLEYGDITTVSFHATKLFHTIEGGAVVTRRPELLKKMSLLRNFGHEGPENFGGLGINGKNSELHAAMGLCNLKYIEQIKTSRNFQASLYDKWLVKSGLQKQSINPSSEYNNAYYPVVFETEEKLLKALRLLNDQWIYPRRYFFPSLDTLPYVETNTCPVADDISKRILCLPMYEGLAEEEVELVCRVILRAQNN